MTTMDVLRSLPLPVPPWAAALAAVACACYVASTVRAYRRLAHVPGPRLAGWTYWPALAAGWRGGRAAATAALAARYGPLVRTGPATVLTSDPALMRRLSSSAAAARRSDWYRILTLDPDVPTLFDARDPALHRDFKARMAPGFAGRESDGLERDIDSQVDAVAALLRRRLDAAMAAGGAGSAQVDMAVLAEYFTLDTMGLLGYGRPFGNLREDRDVIGYKAAVEDSLPLLSMICDVPWLVDWLFSYWGVKLLGPRATDAKGFGRLMKIAKEVTAERFDGKVGDRRDMLGSFIRHGITRAQAEASIPHQILAGGDTTATTLSSTFCQILATPGVYARLVSEIDEAARDGRISAHITAKEARTLPYLQAVIWEGLRYTPPFIGAVMKEVPAGGLEHNGVRLPGGTRVGHNVAGAMQDAATFGADAAAFRPERWLEADADGRAAMTRTVDLIFGAGRSACAGRSVALVELDKFFVQLLRRFDFALAGADAPRAPRCRSYNLCLQYDMWMVFTERRGAT